MNKIQTQTQHKTQTCYPFLIPEAQHEVKQNPSNDENGFKSLFFSIKFIQSLMGSDRRRAQYFQVFIGKRENNRAAAKL